MAAPGAWAQAGAPATGPAAAGSSAAELSKALLADPLNAALRDELTKARAAQAAQRRAAYGALARGLKAYIDLGPAMAHEPLEQASRFPEAASLAKSLDGGLPKLLAECAAAAKAPGGVRGVCAKCGGTARATCTNKRCYGSGRVPCSQCKGSGVIRVSVSVTRSELRYCRNCGALGTVSCDTCRGEGKIACTACKASVPDATRPPRVPPVVQAAMRKVIHKAMWLRMGGIDLYTDRAMAKAAK